MMLRQVSGNWQPTVEIDYDANIIMILQNFQRSV